MSFIAGYLLGLSELHSPGRKTITRNGTYETEGCWNTVTANVPDRYDEGYAAGRASVVIAAKSITANGTYRAETDSADGLDPVTVNVPDRYDEGYAAGRASVAIGAKSVTSNGTYRASDDSLDGFDPVTVNVPDRYDEGYADGYADGSTEGCHGYTFPDGTDYDDIAALCSEDNITDETLGLTIMQETGQQGRDTFIRFYAADTNGNEYSIFRETSGVRVYLSSRIAVTDSVNGTVELTYKWYPSYDPTDIHTTVRTYTYGFLVGFGADGHRFSARNRE